MIRRLLILALVPVVLFTVAGEAQAAYTMGPAINFTWEDHNGDSTQGTTLDCNMKAAYKVTETAGPPAPGQPPPTVLSVKGSSSCVYRTPFADDEESWDDAEVDVAYNGTTPSGQGCSMTAQGTNDMAGGSAPWYYETTGINYTDCAVDEFCMAVEVHEGAITFDLHSSFDACIGLNMGAPPEHDYTDTSCLNGTPQKPLAASIQKLLKDGGNPATSTDWWWKFFTKLQFDARNNGAQWDLTLVWGNAWTGANTRLYQTSDASLGPGWSGTNWELIGSGAGSSINGSRIQVGESPPPPPLIGVQLWPTTVSSPPYYLPPGADKILGLTKPASCVFWFGPKVLDRPADLYDDPWSNTVAYGTPTEDPEDPDLAPDPPDQETDDCTFSVGDPSTWLEGGMCAVVGILGGIWDTLTSILSAIGGLAAAIASAIVGAISDAFQALFIPSEGFLEGQLDSLQDAWADTGPFVFFDGAGDVLGAFAIGDPGSSCAGPTLNITSPVGGQGVALNPMSSCGQMATLAGIVKTALTVGVYVGGFLVALRIVGAAFGLNLSLGKDNES